MCLRVSQSWTGQGVGELEEACRVELYALEAVGN